MARAVIRSVGIVTAVLTPSVAVAESVWVDGGASCPGVGSQEAPYCDPSDGLAHAQPGDVVWVKAFDDPYAALAWPAESVSGTAEAPIVLEPAPGEAPVFTSPLTIDSRQHWIIRGLTVEGGTGPGIDVRSTTSPSTDIQIVGNRVLGVPDRGIKVGWVDDVPTQDIRVEGNYVDQATTTGISLMRGERVVVRNNVVERVACSSGEFIQQFGIEALQGVDDAELSGNVVRGFPACGDATVRTAGINIRTSSRGTIENNLVEVSVESDAAFVGGISVHIDSFDWTVVGNVVRGTRGCGLCDGADFGLATGSSWAHNTVLGVPVGFAANESVGATLEHNLIVASSESVSLISGYADFTSRGNLFWTTGDQDNAFWVSNANFDIDGFGRACGCDEGSLFDEPVLAADELTPRATPALDGAPSSAWRQTFTGDAPDIGALEAPRFVEAAVDLEGLHVIATFDVASPPLLPNGCEGISVLRDGTPLQTRTCMQSIDGSRVDVDVELNEPLFASDVAQLQTTGLVDSASVGGVGARLHPSIVDLDTAHLSEEPIGTTGGEGATSGSGGPSAEPAEPPSSRTCACRSSESPSWAWVLFLLAGARFRRPRRKK